MRSFREFSAFVQTPRPPDLAAAVEICGQKQNNGFLFRELAELSEELRSRQVKIRPFHPSELDSVRKALPAASAFVFGDLRVTSSLLSDLRVEHRVAESYPSALNDLLQRRTWRTTAAVLASRDDASTWPVFAKPVRVRISGGTRCRGRILASRDALREWDWLPPDEPLLCSEVVGWVSEYRCYVMNSGIAGIHPYRIMGTPVYRVDCSSLEQLLPGIRPSIEFVQDAIARLDRAGQSVAGYCLDVGLTTLGKMSLIEMNDGLSLLNYGIPPADYLDLHIARWRELMEICERDAPCARPSETSATAERIAALPIESRLGV